MHTTLYNQKDYQIVLDWVKNLPRSTTLRDFEESIQLKSVQSSTRLWWRSNTLIALAYVDDFNNLWFEIDPTVVKSELEDEVINWGITCQKNRQEHTLDACVGAECPHQLQILEEHGFVRSEVRTLKYNRELDETLPEFPLPAGFTIRPVLGESEVDALVELHRAAFGTKNMTVEERLAIMRTSDYDPALDLLVISPSKELAAFCICTITKENGQIISYTDPIGTHPKYQKLGLARALVAYALHLLKNRGAVKTLLGTSSENLAMQKLAELLGFRVFREDIWLTRNLE